MTRLRLALGAVEDVRAALGPGLTVAEPADLVVIDDLTRLAELRGGLPVLLWAPGASRELVEAAYAAGCADVVDATRLGVAVVRALNSTTREELERARALTQKALASYQRHALQMEVIQQQNEDLDRLAAELARAKRASEGRAFDLETAAHLQGERLTTLSRELRGPLHDILDGCEVLLREEAPALSADGAQELERVRAQTTSLLGLLNDTIDLVRLESGGADVVLEDIDLGALVEETLGALRESLRGRPVELVPLVKPAATRAQTDALKLRRLLHTLVLGALRTVEQGRILVEVDAERGPLASARGDLVIVIRESAPGFEGYADSDAPPSSRSSRGTSLGLTLARELVRRLGGVLDVRTMGSRATYGVRLPGIVTTRAPSTPPVAALAAAAAESAPPATTPRPRILYVEDSAQNRGIVRRYLASRFDLSEAEDGERGVERALHERPDLILMDLSLPKIDGWEATRRIKATPELRHIPVFAVSAHLGIDERTRAWSVGCVEYLTKPLDQKHLVATIQKHLVRP